jgi:hypothetical protein
MFLRLVLVIKTLLIESPDIKIRKFTKNRQHRNLIIKNSRLIKKKIINNISNSLHQYKKII